MSIWAPGTHLPYSKANIRRGRGGLLKPPPHLDMVKILKWFLDERACDLLVADSALHMHSEQLII